MRVHLNAVLQVLFVGTPHQEESTQVGKNSYQTLIQSLRSAVARFACMRAYIRATQ